MPYIIYQFINGEVGLDIQNSNNNDVQKLSKYIPRDILKDTYPNGPTLYDYYKSCINGKWEILAVETSPGWFNAYKGSLAKKYYEDHYIYTAYDMLLMINKTEINNISEEDIESMFV